MTVLFSRRADRDLEDLSPSERRTILNAIFDLAEGLPNSDIRKLQGRTNEWRLRVGLYRVIFSRDNLKKTLDIIRVLPRRDAYR